MICSYSLRNSFISVTLIAGSIAATGCVDPVQPGSTGGADNPVNHIIITDADALSGIELQTEPYRPTTPSENGAIGGWTHTAQGVTATIQVEQADPSVVSPSFSCTIAHYIGPSSPVLPDFIGEAAIGQVDCVGGNGRVIMSVNACSDLVPSCMSDFEVGTTMPGAPFTLGIAVAGTAGVECNGRVDFFPPGFSGINPCG